MKPEVVKQRRKFGPEFTVEAVRLVKGRGVSVAQAAHLRCPWLAIDTLLDSIARKPNGKPAKGIDPFTYPVS